MKRYVLAVLASTYFASPASASWGYCSAEGVGRKVLYISAVFDSDSRPLVGASRGGGRARVTSQRRDAHPSNVMSGGRHLAKAIKVGLARPRP
jgi:hypothetical protein